MRPPLVLLVLIDLVQDFDVLEPVLQRARPDPRFDLRIFVSRWLSRRAPRIAAGLKAAHLPYRHVDRRALLAGQGLPFAGVDAILTASESTAGPHRWVHAAVMAAGRAGVSSFVLQHGVDNLAALAETGGDFASDAMFCWSAAPVWPAGLKETSRRRLIPVGRPAAPGEGGADHDLGVFENLHAKNYTDQQRAFFLQCLMTAARSRPAARIRVRAHPAGGWLDHAAPSLNRLENVTYASSSFGRKDQTSGRVVVARCRRVITTPSTAALDAALAGRPVALALPGGAPYAGLPILRGPDDWLAFIDAPPEPCAGQAAFAARYSIDGDSAGRILDHLAAARRKSVINS